MLKHLLISTLFATSCAASMPPGPAENRQTTEFQAHLAEGEDHLSFNRPAAALESFRKADSMDLAEVPNYEALVHIAKAECLAGATEAGLSTLADFRCAVAVDAGELSCYVGDETLGAPGAVNPQLTEGCSGRMCGEVFLDYYDQSTPEKTRHLATLRTNALEVKEICATAR